MPFYDHQCTKCEHIWEDYFQIGEEVPEECPNCHEKNNIKRLLSLTSPGVVKLTGQEYKQKILADGKKLAKETKSNENLLANMVGETKYNQNQIKRDRAK